MRDTTPEWARWSALAAARPWTVGIEEEVMLLDPRDWSAANRIDEVLRVLPAELAARASAETHACVLELQTGVHPSVASMRALARREPTMAQHVHVAMPHGVDALPERLAAEFAAVTPVSVAAG